MDSSSIDVDLQDAVTNISVIVGMPAFQDSGNEVELHPLGGLQFIRTFPAVAVPYLVITIAACVIGILGNTAALLAIFTYRPLRTWDNAILVNIALADLTVASLGDTFSVVGKSVAFLLCCEGSGGQTVGESDIRWRVLCDKRRADNTSETTAAQWVSIASCNSWVHRKSLLATGRNLHVGLNNVVRKPKSA